MIPMNTLKKTTLAVCATFALSSTAFAASHGDEDPPVCDKPIEVVIHSSYGGGTDVTARMMMIRSRRTLSQDMFVISKRGGSGASSELCSVQACRRMHNHGTDPVPPLHDGAG